MGLLAAIWGLLVAGCLLAPRVGEPLAGALALVGAAVLAWRAHPPRSWWGPGRASALGLALAAGSALGLAFGAGGAGGAAGRGGVAFAVAALVASPFVEELLYREHLLAPLRVRLGALPAVATTAALFGASHLGVGGAPEALGIALAGLLLGGLRLASRSVAPCLGVHAGFNLGALSGAEAFAPPSLVAGGVVLALGLAVAADRGRLAGWGAPAGAGATLLLGAALWPPTPEPPAPVRWLWRSPVGPAADAFFLHPSVAPAGGEAPLRLQLSLDNQARAFARCCRVHVPRYRAAPAGRFFGRGGLGGRPRARAYRDVRSAFERFLAERDPRAPIVLAGHSQGAYHALHLLGDYFRGPLREKLAVAYLAGVPIPQARIAALTGGVPVCVAPRAVGCLVSWNTAGPGATGDLHARAARLLFGRGGGREVPLCVNPLSWRTGERPAGAALHRGAELLVAGARWNPGVAVAARCRRGLLVVDLPEPLSERLRGPDDSHHLLDYTLFFRNVEQDASERVATLLAARAGGVSGSVRGPAASLNEVLRDPRRRGRVSD